MKKYILLVLLILWMGLIFAFSNREGATSSKDSHSIVRVTIGNIYKIFNRDASEEEIDKVIDRWENPVRKLAHFTEYFILGILMFFTLKEFGIKNIYIAILLCFLYACSDEIHQLFVPLRNGNFKDVLIDTSGSVLSILLLKKKNK